MPTVKNVAMAPVDLPTGQLLRRGKSIDITDELLAHPEVVALLEQGALVNVDEAPELEPPAPPAAKKLTRPELVALLTEHEISIPNKATAADLKRLAEANNLIEEHTA